MNAVRDWFRNGAAMVTEMTSVTFLETPQEALAEAGPFLVTEPALNNLILTLLHARVAHPEPGHYWIARDGNAVIGAALQSPLTFPLVLSEMTPGVATALADAISDAGVALPGAGGEVRSAAEFAGRWAGTRKEPVRAHETQSLFEAHSVSVPTGSPNALRLASIDDRQLVIEWMTAFQQEVGHPAEGIPEIAERRITAGQIWLWDEGDGFVSMAALTVPIEKVSRVQYVYTPPELRCRGYARACVAHLTRRLLDQDLRPILYTDLENPTSNGIYARIGYRPISDILRYRFGPHASYGR